MKKSFSLLIAIVFVLILSFLLLYTLSNLSSSVQKTSQIYLHEQAQLLARSGTEFAIMAIQGHDPSSSCLHSINLNYNDTFDVNITIYYMGRGLPAGCNTLANDIQTPESNGTAIIDVKVSLRRALTNSGATPISYFRRTLQKL
ncbi:MAG: hypothetical protein C6H99_01715 [Epsilonproteobacteria bacterium]|nr:hypothetical protein [Campylobacterota bacterium]NPA65078.1 type II secretion system protein [Campylobacterota bacterium]